MGVPLKQGRQNFELLNRLRQMYRIFEIDKY